jgi:hypothetical protein
VSGLAKTNPGAFPMEVSVSVGKGDRLGKVTVTSAGDPNKVY